MNKNVKVGDIIWSLYNDAIFIVDTDGPFDLIGVIINKAGDLFPEIDRSLQDQGYDVIRINKDDIPDKFLDKFPGIYITTQHLYMKPSDFIDKKYVNWGALKWGDKSAYTNRNIYTIYKIYGNTNTDPGPQKIKIISNDGRNDMCIEPSRIDDMDDNKFHVLPFNIDWLKIKIKDIYNKFGFSGNIDNTSVEEVKDEVNTADEFTEDNKEDIKEVLPPGIKEETIYHFDTNYFKPGEFFAIYKENKLFKKCILLNSTPTVLEFVYVDDEQNKTKTYSITSISYKIDTDKNKNSIRIVKIEVGDFYE